MEHQGCATRKTVMKEKLRPEVSEEERRLRRGIVAVIPARGGSKGIYRKNLASLCGKPLMAYTIEVALRCRLVERVLVSTDDPEVAEVAREHGAWVPWLRDKRFGGDRSSLFDVWEEAKTRLRADGIPLKSLVKLLPTHPFRTPWLIDHLIGKTLKGHTSAFTVRRIRGIFGRYYTNGHGYLQPVYCPLETFGQYDWPMMRPYGLVAVITYARPHNQYFHVVDNPVSLIDIDTSRELKLAEAIISGNLFDFTDTGPEKPKASGGVQC
jgi:CMP-N-acetylneuraminic acid synthetase